MIKTIRDYIDLVESLHMTEADYHQRKAERTKAFQANKGLKMVTCGACNGSGVYDNVGTPPCSACDGTGKVREKPKSEPIQKPHWRDKLAADTDRKRR